MPPERFETLVAEALDLIPDDLHALIDNLAVFAIDEHPEDPDLLGLYDGIPLTERENYGGMIMPDRIFIYRLPICALSEAEPEIVEQIQVTVVHEVAHHFGISDERLEELGWD